MAKEVIPTAAQSPVIDDYPITRAEPNFSAVMLFYNPGDAYSDTIRYDHPIRVAGDPRFYQPCLYQLRMPERGFIEVPGAVTLFNDDSGQETDAIIGGMYQKFMNLFRGRGCVLVEEKRHKSRVNDTHIAPTREAAVKLGDKLYRAYLIDLASEWNQIVEKHRAAGGVPRPASGLYATALAKLSLADPADPVNSILNERAQVASASEQDRQIGELRNLLHEQNLKFERLMGTLMPSPDASAAPTK